MSIIIRPARPEDADFLGWACVAAARSQLERGWFEIVLQREEAYCVEFAKYLTLAKARSWWHWSLFHVVESHGEPVSAMCGFGDDSVYQASYDAMAEASERMNIPKSEQEQFWPRGAFIVSAATSEDGAWTIENVATKPEFRGMGLTYALMQVELGVARSKGFKRAQISIFVGNDAAEKNYLKSDFKFAEEKHAPDFEAALGIPGTRRFVRNL